MMKGYLVYNKTTLVLDRTYHYRQAAVNRASKLGAEYTWTTTGLYQREREAKCRFPDTVDIHQNPCIMVYMDDTSMTNTKGV